MYMEGGGKEEEKVECGKVEKEIAIAQENNHVHHNPMNYQYVMLMLKVGMGYQVLTDISSFFGYKEAMDSPNILEVGEENSGYSY